MKKGQIICRGIKQYRMIDGVVHWNWLGYWSTLYIDKYETQYEEYSNEILQDEV
jgi:hypothetical protein